VSAAKAAKPVKAAAADLDRVVDGQHHEPHAILGPHPKHGAVTVRVLRPLAESVTVLVGDEAYPCEHEHRGIWVAVLPMKKVPDYRLVVEYAGAAVHVDDPYRYLPTLGELDLHLIGEGRHERLWDVLGAHVRTYDTLGGPVTGTSFAVWAPNASGVRLIGDFNHWDGTAHPMRSLGSSGVWEIFVPGVGDGAYYKFAILGPDGHWRQKADPMAFATEVPPATASVAFTTTYSWQDQAWIEARAEGDPHRKPISIYELHLGSWRPGLDYRQLATELVEYVTECGFTHVELLPVAEHPSGPSWGYQVTSYYAPTARFGSPDDLRMLIDSLHRAGVRVHYSANVTGHGWRKLLRHPRTLGYRIHTLPPVPAVLRFIQQHAGLADEQAYGTLNMGAGFALFVPAADAARTVAVAAAQGVPAWVAGTVEAGSKRLVIEPLGLAFEGDALALR